MKWVAKKTEGEDEPVSKARRPVPMASPQIAARFEGKDRKEAKGGPALFVLTSALHFQRFLHSASKWTAKTEEEPKAGIRLLVAVFTPLQILRARAIERARGSGREAGAGRGRGLRCNRSASLGSCAGKSARAEEEDWSMGLTWAFCPHLSYSRMGRVSALRLRLDMDGRQLRTP